MDRTRTGVPPLTLAAVGVLLLLVAATGVERAAAHTYHTGECPSVEPMSGFDIHQVKAANACALSAFRTHVLIAFVRTEHSALSTRIPVC